MIATADDLTAEQIARITSLPTTLGRYVGKHYFNQPYKPHLWQLDLERHIVSMLYRPGNEILIVSVPSQEGKSHTCSRLLPFWYLGRNPYHTVMLIGYNETISTMHGRQVRGLMQTFGQRLYGVGVDNTSDSESDWLMDNRIGGMVSTGIRSGISGRTVHLVIADDTLAGAEEANSAPRKKRNIDEWDGAVTNRFQEDTKALVVGTRWAIDDLPGVLLERSRASDYEGFPIHYLNYKALADPDPEEKAGMSPEMLEEWRDHLGRKQGEHLEGQHSRRFFLMTKASKPSLVWSCMYQGTPETSEDGMFPRTKWRFWIDNEGQRQDASDMILPEIVHRARVWDMAASQGQGDWTVGTLVGQDAHRNIFILGRERFRLAPGGVLDRVRKAAELDGFETPIRIEEERSGAGPTVIAAFKRELIGYDVQGLRAEGDKTSRAVPYSQVQNAMRAFLPRDDTTWENGTVKDWVDRHAQMDGNGGLPAFDDEIDTAAYAVRFLLGPGDSMIASSENIAARDDMTPDEKMEVAAIRRQLGLS